MKDGGEITVADSVLTSKGQVTLPKVVREALGVAPGDRVRYVIGDNGQVRMIAVRPLSRLFGVLRHDGPPRMLEDMDRAIADGANGR